MLAFVISAIATIFVAAMGDSFVWRALAGIKAAIRGILALVTLPVVLLYRFLRWQGNKPGEGQGAPHRQVGARLGKLMRELDELYPEREHLTKQLLYALATREHVLVHGMYGTAKTQLSNAVFSSFEGQKTFSVQLTKFMTEANVIGVPDPNRMRQDGVLYYRPEGGILEANFAELDELFDANAPLLRTLLGVLNEREFKRGKQKEQALLHTAMAATNGDPQQVVQQSPELGAVVDRFLFRCNIDYLVRHDSRLRMYKNFAAAKKPETRISYESLAVFSDFVLNKMRISDVQFLKLYDRVLEAYRIKVPDQIISDRRACRLLNVIKANALLNGRTEVVPDDILAVRWGLCMGNDKFQHRAFMDVAVPLIEERKERRRHRSWWQSKGVART